MKTLTPSQMSVLKQLTRDQWLRIATYASGSTILSLLDRGLIEAHYPGNPLPQRWCDYDLRLTEKGCEALGSRASLASLRAQRGDLTKKINRATELLKGNKNKYELWGLTNSSSGFREHRDALDREIKARKPSPRLHWWKCQNCGLTWGRARKSEPRACRSCKKKSAMSYKGHRRRNELAPQRDAVLVEE